MLLVRVSAFSDATLGDKLTESIEIIILKRALICIIHNIHISVLSALETWSGTTRTFDNSQINNIME